MPGNARPEPTQLPRRTAGLLTRACGVAGRALVLTIVVLATPLGGCGTALPVTEPDGAELPLSLGRTQQQEKDGVSVEVSVPTDELASRTFGVPLASHGIQPVWLRIENRTPTGFWLLPIAIDPDLFSPDEAALTTGASLLRAERAANLERFRRHALAFYTPPGEVNEGYVYASHQRGGRYVDVRLTTHGKAVRMRFAVLLPTEGFDYEKSELRRLYAAVDEAPDLSPDQLRERLEALPCCTTNREGAGAGDPLNLVLVGSASQVIAALTAGGWHFTEAITIDSIRRMIGAAIEERAFPSAPISALHAFGRSQDIALQRGRDTISQRNHMRLWLAPFRSEGRPVWVGQVSRDIGVKVTTLSPTLTTHVIDPIVDEAREYLLHSLLHHDSVARFAFVEGVGRSEAAQPRRNLTDDPYLTDGMRLVVWLSSDPVPPQFARDMGWNDSADPSREARGERSLVPALVED